mmetsp:Transcript_13579/g.20263  ORF Transcript_13579/g.20263 Transcript_13579/m.20263 type:complete len:323 (-) Transcript_13579:170-1138(-)
MLNRNVIVTGVIAILFSIWFKICDCDLGLALLQLRGLPDDAFSGKRVWIIGASSGIGASLVCEYTERGASVVISSRRVSLLQAVAEKCNAGKTFVLPLDVLDINTHENALNAATKALSGIPEILILNSGRSQRQTILDAPLETSREILELNFFALISIARIWSKQLLSMTHGTTKQDGQLIITSSLSGKIGTPAGSSYSASKFALHGFFDSFRMEMYPRINVLIACPGPVVSEIAKFAHGKAATEFDSNKMPTKRCSYLMTLASFYNYDEVWISRNPELFFTYLLQYVPRLGHALGRRLGPKRVKALQQGRDLFDSSTYLFK